MVFCVPVNLYNFAYGIFYIGNSIGIHMDKRRYMIHLDFESVKEFNVYI